MQDVVRTGVERSLTIEIGSGLARDSYLFIEHFLAKRDDWRTRQFTSAWEAGFSHSLMLTYRRRNPTF